MQTFLLAWNPEIWPWHDLPEMADKVGREGSAERWWRCVSHRKAQPDHRVFLIRLGVEPRGIMAAGWIVDGPEERPHYEPQRAANNEKAWFVRVRFDALLNPAVEPILPHEQLSHQRILSAQNWSPRGSGISIRSDIAAELEVVWAQFVAGRTNKSPSSANRINNA